MDSHRQNTHSIWQEDVDFSFPILRQNLKTDVCIVGAGISGLTTAYLLLTEGQKVVVLDKDKFAMNETGLSSAHLSNALDDGFVQLEKLHGVRGSRLAFDSHSVAIDVIEEIVNSEDIQCGFVRLDGYLFNGPENDISDLEEEFDAATRAGMQDISLLEKSPFGLDLGPCLRFKNQAQFNPVLYLRGLARCVERMGGIIFSRSLVTKITGGPRAKVETNEGYHVQCENVVVATNVPINDLVAIHTKEASYRTYVIGLRVPHGTFPKALFWDMAKPYHYVRVASGGEGETYDVLLVGGEDHKTGQDSDPEIHFSNLAKWAEEKFGTERRIVSQWSGQIIEPVDGLAYIGVNPGAESNVFMVSGDSGHGITHGTIAGILITDLIMDRENPWEHLYNPSRISLKGMGHYFGENLNTFWQYKDWVTKGDLRSEEDLAPGEGTVIRDGLSMVAVFRSYDGKVHRFSATCPHLGGVVHWNSVEQTWDCPCHGSRFSKSGEVINGPACHDLQPHKKPGRRNRPSFKPARADV